MLPRYRYPGEVRVPESCCKENCRPYTVVKGVNKVPFVKDRACNPNIYDRAIVRRIPCDLKCEIKPKFILETFNNLLLCPINLNKFCAYNFEDGEVVAVEAENVSGVVCKKDYCGDFDDVIPVKIFNIKRVWHKLIREIRGIVTRNLDSNGIPYYRLTEITTLPEGTGIERLSQDQLLFYPIHITYEIYNIMNVENSEETLRSLDGKIIDAVYVDYGHETRDRIGFPIVIINFRH
jgi:hypothetical protein